MEYAGLTISIFAIVLSGLTAWLTWFRKGEIKMTRPTVISFLHEQSSDPSRPAHPKVFLRSLLYATAYRGCVLEYLYLKLARGEKVQNFAVWVYAETSGELARGSGLFIGQQGLACNHHFLLMDGDEAEFRFVEGVYRLEVWGAIVGRSEKLLSSTELRLDATHAKSIADDSSVYFDWGPSSSSYVVHYRKHDKKESFEDSFRRYTQLMEKLTVQEPSPLEHRPEGP